MFYHIIFKNREICWQYGSRVNYNLDLRVVDGAPRAPNSSNSFFLFLFPTVAPSGRGDIVPSAH